jgi:F-type H+-transporting ATPase subunit epsilon
MVAAVDDGFISVAANRVSILAGHADLATDIDLSQARSDLERAQGEGDDRGSEAEVRRLRARVRAAERVS